jgi:hypothetical protein
MRDDRLPRTCRSRTCSASVSNIVSPLHGHLWRLLQRLQVYCSVGTDGNNYHQSRQFTTPRALQFGACPVWTTENRRKYEPRRVPYPSYRTDDERARVEHLIQPGCHRPLVFARQRRSHDLPGIDIDGELLLLPRAARLGVSTSTHYR